MMNNAINFVALFLRDGLVDVHGFANLMLVLFALTILTEILTAIHDRYRENKIP